MGSRQTDRQLQRIHGLPGVAISRTFDGTSKQSTALTVNTTYMLSATQDCHFLISASPTALTTSTFLAAGAIWPITIPDVDIVYLIGVIQADTAGTLTITPMSGKHA